ncbi:histidine phosphatase family protein [Longispora sp. NPDC051575]|uniref:histidine phosphatase family protein n=1 Tax=Longispora sp. NPDC051575 TaxID=3154943 RepID=UPI00342806C5
MGDIVLLRHGETDWSLAGRHTSTTDLPLTARGEDQAALVRPALAARAFAAVWVSPRLRARRSADLAGLTPTAVDPDLAEWDYGDYEGVTTADIRLGRPGWDLWRDGCPGGESPKDVGARLDRVLGRARPLLAHGDVAFVAHGHSLRVCGARWIDLPPAGGASLRLDTSTLSVLGYERDTPVLLRWNAPVG